MPSTANPSERMMPQVSLVYSEALTHVHHTKRRYLCLGGLSVCKVHSIKRAHKTAETLHRYAEWCMS